MAVKFKDTININGQYTLPLTDGADGQVLVTDGAGNLTFSSESIAGSADSAESTHLNVKNTSGASIAKGTPVYVTGNVGATDKLEIAPADASNASHMPAIGLLESTLANNGEGFVVQGGLLKGLATATIDGSSSTANDTVYVKAGGGLTLTKPTGSTNFIQNIAKVARVHSSNGSLIVSSILRTNDVPNLSTGKIWVGDSNTIESTVVHIDETNGRVGIGTDTPSEHLHIKDSTAADFTTIRIEGFTAAADDPIGALEFYNTTGAPSAEVAGFIKMQAASGGRRQYEMLFGTGNNTAADTKMIIDKLGQVGIGTDSPSTTLEVNAGTSNIVSKFISTDAQARIEFTDSTTSAQVSIGAEGDDFVAYTNSTEHMRIDSSGRVGINETNPSTAKLVIETGPTSGIDLYRSAVNANFDAFRFRDSTNANTEASIGWSADQLRLNSTNNTVFTTGGTERMRIDSSGVSKFIPTKAYGDTSSSLKIFGAFTGTNYSDGSYYNLVFGDDDATNGYLGSITVKQLNASASTASEMLFYTNAGGGNSAVNPRMVIDSSGNVGIGTTSPSQKLTVVGNAYIAGGLLLLDDNQPIQWGNSQQKIKGNNNGYLQFITGNSEKMRIDSSGNVGIGTSPYASTLGTFTSIDLGQSASMWGYLNSVYLNSNAYFNNGWLYKNTGSAGVLQVDGNVLTFRHAISGTANTAIGLSEAFRISSRWNVTATVDMRAPIFYDSQNTNYYVDPTSTSKFETINIVDSASTHGVLHTDDPYHGLTMRGYPNTANSIAMTAGDYMSFWEYGGVFRFYKKRPSVLTLQAWIDNGSITATTDSRAPIFYDSDNTGYYVNPAGNSSIKGNVPSCFCRRIGNTKSSALFGPI